VSRLPLMLEAGAPSFDPLNGLVHGLSPRCNLLNTFSLHLPLIVCIGSMVSFLDSRQLTPLVPGKWLARFDRKLEWGTSSRQVQ